MTDKNLLLGRPALLNAARVNAARVNSRTGEIVWRAEPGGLVNYVSGPYVYSVASYQPPEVDEADAFQLLETGFEARPYLRLRRLNPRNGRELWLHYQERAPLDVQFERNTIRLVFKKEVQVLEFFSF